MADCLDHMLRTCGQCGGLTGVTERCRTTCAPKGGEGVTDSLMCATCDMPVCDTCHPRGTADPTDMCGRSGKDEAMRLHDALRA